LKVQDHSHTDIQVSCSVVPDGRSSNSKWTRSILHT